MQEVKAFDDQEQKATEQYDGEKMAPNDNFKALPEENWQLITDDTEISNLIRHEFRQENSSIDEHSIEDANYHLLESHLQHIPTSISTVIIDESVAICEHENVEEHSEETNVNRVFRSLLNELSANVFSPNQQNELPFVYPRSATEIASPILQRDESDAMQDLVETTTTAHLSQNLEKKNDLGTHLLERINTLLIQLQIDLSKDNSSITPSASAQPCQDFQSDISTNSIEIEITPSCCSDLTGLKCVMKNSEYSSGRCMSTINNSFQQSIDTECVCLNLNSSDLNITDHVNCTIQSFKDKCACISYLLSTRKKLIFFVTSAAAAKVVVPMIHDHKYIRYIYVNSDIELDMSWMRNFGKLRGCWSSIDQMTKQMTFDIQSCRTRSSRWSRDSSLLVQLWAQSSNKSSSNIMILPKQKTSETTAVVNVVMLHYNAYRPFRLSHDLIKVYEFDDVEYCRDFIQQCDLRSSVFLIACITSMDFYEIVQSCMKFDTVHAAYIFCTSNTSTNLQTILSNDHMKLSGIFSQPNNILLQLCNDICFYRELFFHVPSITILRSDVNSIDKLNNYEVDFVHFQLFLEILPEISCIIDPSTTLDMVSSDSLFPALITNPNFGQVVNILCKQCSLPILLDASSLLNRTNQRLNVLTVESDVPSTVIYRAQIVNREHLSILRDNINSLLTIHTFTLFSRSFTSIIDICQRCVDNGLLVVLLEIEMSGDTTFARIDTNTFVCHFGSVFRILSIDEIPGGIWHAQLESVDCAMDYIKEQLPFTINVRNTWLTFGNYMTALERFEEAKMYYEYLLHNISPEDPIRASIYNNMGLVYSAMNKENEALKFFEKSSTVFVESASMYTKKSDLRSFKRRSISELDFNPVTLYGKIAEGYDRQAEYTKALDYYRKALEFAEDSMTNLFYRAAVERTLEKLAK